jgi:undecaprenyl-diphosphatase
MKKIIPQKRFLLLSLLFLFCFSTVALLRDSFSTINLSVNLWAASVNTGSFDLVAKLISIAFDTTTLIVASLAVAVILFLYHHGRYSFLLLCAMAGDALLVDICKTLIASPRPLNEIIIETNFSFPSGHVTGVIVFFGLLTYMAWRHWTSIKRRALTVTIYLSLTTLVGFDRIYLNVHWFSDVIGAVFLGTFWLFFTIYIFNRLVAKDKITWFRK